jgi:hypothetical protein
MVEIDHIGENLGSPAGVVRNTAISLGFVCDKQSAGAPAVSCGDVAAFDLAERVALQRFL